MKIKKISKENFNGFVYNFGVKDNHSYIANNIIVHNCYEGCAKEGKHARLINLDGSFAQPWMNTLQPWTELALNGNDLDIPDLDMFLLKMQEKHIITNITVNQNQFLKHVDYLKYLTDKKMIYGLGISLNNVKSDSLWKLIKDFPNAVIHTIAGILTENDIQYLMDNHAKVLVLGYKLLGRGVDYAWDFSDSINKNMKVLKSLLPEMVQKCKVVSFDNLAIEQLGVKELLFKDKENEWDEFYMGDDGNFTLYIDAVKEQFAKNSCMPKDERFPIEGRSMTDMFNFIRDRYKIKH